jgi:hypothetical protein
MSELRTNKIYPRDGLPAGASGGIIQIVEKIDATTNTTTSTSWTNLGVEGLNLSITPTSASNKILMMVTMQLECGTGSNTGSIIFARNPTGTPVYFANSGVASGLDPGNNSTGISKFFLSQGYSGLNGQTTSHFGVDSPGTTSSVTYGVLWGTNSGTAYYNRGGSGYNGSSSIILMEVSG